MPFSIERPAHNGRIYCWSGIFIANLLVNVKNGCNYKQPGAAVEKIDKINKLLFHSLEIKLYQGPFVYFFNIRL